MGPKQFFALLFFLYCSPKTQERQFSVFEISLQKLKNENFLFSNFFYYISENDLTKRILYFSFMKTKNT